MNAISEFVEYPPRQYRMELTVGDHSPRHVRRIVRAYLRLWDMPELSDAVELALTEVLTNIHQHVPDRWCRITLRWLPDGVRAEVHDRYPALPTPRTATALDETGRGLAIVALVADKHDVELAPPGKTVWFECLIGVSSTGQAENQST